VDLNLSGYAQRIMAISLPIINLEGIRNWTGYSNVYCIGSLGKHTRQPDVREVCRHPDPRRPELVRGYFT
jgi:hypothetical protein